MTKSLDLGYNWLGDTKMQYRRKMGIDYGDKRIGIAFSDLLGMISSAYQVLQNKDEQSSLQFLSKLAKEKEVDLIVMGLPLNMQGQENERTIITRDFGEKLSRMSGLKVVYEDERLSSVEADEILIGQKMKWEDRKKFIDMFSAQVILQSYLDNKRK